ncbi:hypothetical protein MMC13_005392 [Lambiella insularis]|nr:hypothetical protein [Lambiella insularis]
MSTFSFELLTGDEITDDILKPAARLFSANYGVWGPLAAPNLGPFAQPGRRMRISPSKLRQQCLPPGVRNTYVCAHLNDQLVGHAFATRWLPRGRPVCWITQLVVSASYRRRGLATQLLQKVRKGEDDAAVGILSSHPAAILATLRAFGRGIEDVDLGMTREHAHAIMQSSPVPYVKTAQLHGSLFGDEVTDGAVASADTGFWVDHGEPLEVLEAVRARGVGWPFGELMEGHEFVVLVEVGEAEAQRGSGGGL